MRQLVVLAVVAALAAASPRERRQAPDHAAVHVEYAPCRGGNGICVPYYLCRNDTVITDGAGIIDIRLGPGQECPSYLDICCTNPLVEPPIIEPPKYQSVCGRRNNQGIDVRIQGFQSNETQVGEFPWMAAVLKKEYVSDETIKLYTCGGSLIHESIVLTAAHCVHKFSANPTDLTVRLGEWDTQNEYEPYKHQERDVAGVVIHPYFNPSNLQNDFALLYLKTPAILSRNVDVICLDGFFVPAAYQDCVVTGWGKDRFGKKGVFQNVLKSIALPYVDPVSCQTALRTTRLGPFFKLDKSFLCAGGELGKDSCSGDGGSPLVCLDNTKTQYVQVGIVAWGIGCGEGGIPGVYANLIDGYEWIVTEADKLLEGGPPVADYWKYV